MASPPVSSPRHLIPKTEVSVVGVERTRASDAGYSVMLNRGCIVRCATLWRSGALQDKANKGVHRALTGPYGIFSKILGLETF